MKVFIASDHGGFELKESIKSHLLKQGFEIIDLGPETNASVDYPDYAVRVAEKVVESNAFGVLVCGTGIGMSIAANKVKGARAALVHDEFTARMSRNHNNANIICLGQKNIDTEKALALVDIFLKEGFDGLKPESERHKKRVEKINQIEKKFFK